jgi:hypothetical protein
MPVLAVRHVERAGGDERAVPGAAQEELLGRVVPALRGQGPDERRGPTRVPGPVDRVGDRIQAEKVLGSRRVGGIHSLDVQIDHADQPDCPGEARLAIFVPQSIASAPVAGRSTLDGDDNLVLTTCSPAGVMSACPCGAAARPTSTSDSSSLVTRQELS